MGLRVTVSLVCAIAMIAIAHAQPAPTSPSPSPAPPSTYTRPAGSAPLPPSMPAAELGDPDLEPQITIIRRETETVEEARVNGELRYVKVTPRIGRPYYLVPSGNGQTFLRYDSLDFGLRTPMWLLFSW